MSRILGTREVGKLLNLSKPTVIKLANRGEIPGRLIGHTWCFREDLILEMLDTRKEKPREDSASAA